MRLIPLSVAMLLLTISGCAMTNPLARRSPREIDRERIFADAKAQFDQGNFRAGQQILEQLREDADGSLEVPGRDTNSETRPVALQQNLPGTTPQDYDELLETLVAQQPLSERAAKRESYRRLTAAQLRQILSSYESAHLIGQSRLQKLQALPETNDARLPSTIIAGRTPPARGVTAAPDPRLVGGQPPLGIATPWDRPSPSVTAQTGTVSSGPVVAAQTDTLPGAPVFPGPGVLPTGGVAAAGNRQAVSHLGGTMESGQTLPSINPGPGGGYDLPQIYPAGSAPVDIPQAIIQSSAVDVPTQSVTSPAQVTSPVQLLPPVEPQQADGGVPQTVIPPREPVNGGSGQTGLPGGGQKPSTGPDQAAPTGFGLPERLSEGVQNLLPNLRDAAGRLTPSIRQFTGVPGTAVETTGAIGTTGDVNGLVAQLEAQLAAAAPGETEAEKLDYVRRHVNLRLLYLVADRSDQALEPIQGISADRQEFWQQLMWSMSSYFDTQGQPERSQRATQTVDQLRTAITRLQSAADLQLRNVSFCHKIVSFGNYERFSRDQFTPGQPVLLYSEVDNFKSVMVDSDRFRTALKSTIEIHKSGASGPPLEVIEFPVTEDLCRNYRRDYFHSYEFSIPQKLEPGLYRLILKAEDQLGEKMAESSVNFEVE